MKVIELNIEVDQAFGNLHRDRCVLIAVKDKDDKLLSGAKPGFFPPTITRLLGGDWIKVNGLKLPLFASYLKS